MLVHLTFWNHFCEKNFSRQCWIKQLSMLKVIVTSRTLRRRSILNLWMPVTVEEVKKFIGVIFNALDIIGKKHLAILRFLLCDDNDETYNNRLGKVKYLVDMYHYNERYLCTRRSFITWWITYVTDASTYYLPIHQKLKTQGGTLE